MGRYLKCVLGRLGVYLMNRTRIAVYVGLLAVSSAVSAQQPLREFAEYRGTWALDESAGDIRALRVARTLVITTTRTEITVTRDSDLPEVYPIDGTESKTRDLQAGAPIEHRYRLLVIADTLELTSKTKQDNARPTLTHIATDAYRVSGDTLTVGRQRDFVTVEREHAEPPGHLTAFVAPANYIQTLVYRRR
jgi:hypothetical protein